MCAVVYSIAKTLVHTLCCMSVPHTHTHTNTHTHTTHTHIHAHMHMHTHAHAPIKHLLPFLVEERESETKRKRALLYYVAAHPDTEYPRSTTFAYPPARAHARTHTHTHTHTHSYTHEHLPVDAFAVLIQ